MVIGWRAWCYHDNDGGDDDNSVGGGSGDGCIIALVWVDSKDIISLDRDIVNFPDPLANESETENQT